MLHHLKIPDTFAERLLTHRLPVLACYVILTVAAIFVVWQAPLHVSLLQGLMPDEAEYRAYVDRASQFGGGSDDLVYVATREGARLFTPKTLTQIRAAARALEELPEIDRVFSIADAARLAPDRTLSAREVAARSILRRRLASGVVPEVDVRQITPGLYWPESKLQQTGVDFVRLESEIRQDPIAGHLISRGGDAQAMLVWLTESSNLLNQPQSGIRQKIEQVLHEHGLGREGTYCVGTSIIQDWMYDEVIQAIVWILPIVTLVVSLLVYGIYRRLSYVLLTLLIAGTAIVWTLGLIAMVFGEITLLVAATPGLILILSTADTIHLVSAYAAELRRGLNRHDAVAKAVQDVGGACLLTSLTTFIGFLSLAVVPAVAVRHLAIACAVGVASALLLALTLVPMALMILKPPIAARKRPSRVNGALDWVVGVCRHCSLTWPRTVIGIHLLIFVAAVIAATRTHLDADLPARFVPGHPIRESIDFFHEEIAATTCIELVLQTDPDETLSLRTLKGLAQLEQRLGALPEIQSVSSITTAFRLVDSLLGSDPDREVPKTQAEASATVAFLRSIEPEMVDGFVSPHAGLLRVSVQVTSTRIMQVAGLAERIERLARQSLPDNVAVSSSGFYVVVGKAAREILVSQIQGFTLCFACVMIVITLGVRSLHLGLIAMAPNILPLALLGGILALTSKTIDTDILGVAIISFGLAVDDTIHFLHRYDIERRGSASIRDAIEGTFNYTGSAIIRTTAILGCGLLPFAFSSYLSIRFLGTYLVFVLACAVLADLLLLPASVLLFDKESRGDLPSAVRQAE